MREFKGREEVGRGEGEGGGMEKQLGGRGAESGDCEKSISAEYLIKFKPSDLSLLPGSKASADTGERGGKSCRKEGDERAKDDHSVGFGARAGGVSYRIIPLESKCL